MDSDAEDIEGFSLPAGSRPGDVLGRMSDGEASDLDVDVVWEEEDRPAVLKRVSVPLLPLGQLLRRGKWRCWRSRTAAVQLSLDQGHRARCAACSVA
jgi:hypothetical protein